MKLSSRLGLLAIVLTLPGTLGAQSAPKIGGNVQLWYNQIGDNNLRNNSAAPMGYYNLRSEFKEDGFAVRRAEINVSGSVLPSVDYYAMIDPSINTSSQSTTYTTTATTTNGVTTYTTKAVTNTNSSYNPTILQDLFLTWHQDAFAVRMGQMKTLQTYEGNISSSELLFAERSQLGRVFGDKRDRGVYASFQGGDPKEGFGTKITAGFFNGVSDLASGKASDLNSQKDFIARLDFNVGSKHKFGAYTLQGETDQKDATGAQVALTFAGAGAPTASTVLADKDKTTNMGVYYVYQDSNWHFSAEYITGLLGRRFASITNVSTGGAALRDYLEQKFEGYYLTGAYKMGANSFQLRYDYLNYNSGDNWYGANPYVTAATDYTPKYKETTLGYTYAFNPGLVKSANFKLNYIIRSKNFLKPLAAAGETSEQGGNNLVAAFQVAF